MKRIIIDGDIELKGEIKIAGAKNSAVALLPAAILCDEHLTIANVPNVSDIDYLINILEFLGASIKKNEDELEINCLNIKNKKIEEKMCNKLRASYYFMGALLGKFKEVEIYFPGGCSLGPRPIDQHIKGFLALGATITIDQNKYIIKAQKLVGTKINLDVSSVGATINIMLAATKAEGQTIILNAAKEPEIVNIATFLNSMGANIKGAGTSTITILGVEYLKKGFVEVIPDRIEAGTYLIMSVITAKEVTIYPIIKEHIEALVSKLEEMGANIKIVDNKCIVKKTNNLKSLPVKTSVFPGFPTDLQQPIMALLTQCTGESKIEEAIYKDRFKQADYLNKMGASIRIESPVAYIHGKTILTGEEVVATDLRAGASLIIAGLIAKGTTIINDAEHILRGYDKIVDKLTKVGAKITLEEI